LYIDFMKFLNKHCQGLSQCPAHWFMRYLVLQQVNS
jgi:hypothetical protein